MFSEKISRGAAALTACCFFAGCGTVVPQIGEISDAGTVGTSSDLELLIKTKLFCELAHAVSYVNGKALGLDGKLRDDLPVLEDGAKKTTIHPIPESWGVLMTIQLVVVENTVVNPSTTITPGGGVFILNASATASSEATRTDKFSFYYPIKNLYAYNDECITPPNNQKSPLLNTGSSLLIESDVGILPWLKNAGNVRTSMGISIKNSLETLSYDAKFEVVTSGTLSPQWKLTHVTADPTGNLFSAKRDRTHELTLTFGPTSDGKGGGGPSTLTSNSALASEFGTAAGVAFKNAISPAGR